MFVDASGRGIAYRISYLSQGRIACPAVLGYLCVPGGLQLPDDDLRNFCFG